MNRETKLKIQYEKQLDRLIKERRELYSIIGEEIPNNIMYRSCLKSIQEKTRIITILTNKWREVNGLR